jgi:DNA-binding NarL/FixJ family response regulator
MSAAVRVLLVDDEPLVRRGLRAILQSDPEIEVVGEAGDGAEALASTRSLKPDVVCMDVRMPGVDGIRATELVLALDPPPSVLVVTTFESDEYVLDALRAGASGFLLKRADADQVVAAVRAVAAGESLLFPESVRRMVLRHGPARTTYDGPALTPRESEVLALVARGMSNPEIADALVLGVETVRTHVANVLAKLGARDRTQAVVIAYEAGLVTTVASNNR